MKTFGLAALFVLGSGTATWPAIDSEQLNKSTVKITVKHGGGAEAGAGVVLCHQNGVLYVLTAKHVLYGGTGTPFTGVSAVEVEFYQNRWPAVKAERSAFEIKRATNKDLAMLQIKMAGDHLARAWTGKSAGLKQLDEVYTTGHPVSMSKNWLAMKGEVNEVGEFILYSANVEEGYSGGPVVNQKGELIGLNVQIAKTGESGKIAHALPIDEVLSTISPWLDLNCLQKKEAQSASQTQGLADTPDSDLYTIFNTYYGLRQAGSKDLSAYRRWAEQAESAVRAQYPESRTARELERLSTSLQSVRDETELELTLREMEYTFEDLGQELEVILQGGELGTGKTSKDPWAGEYVLTGTRDLYGNIYSPPYVQGTLKIQNTGSQQYVLTWQVTLLQAYLSQNITGILNGYVFSGTVSNSTLVVNNGLFWQATFGSMQDGLTTLLSDGATWFWRKQR